MTRLVYACRFEVPADDGLARTIIAYEGWLEAHYVSRRGIPDIAIKLAEGGDKSGLPVGHQLSTANYEYDGARALRIHWSYPDDVDAGLRWSNDVRIGQFGSRCSVEHLIAIESVEYNVAPARLLFGSPRVIRDICIGSAAYVGDMRIMATPYALTRDGLADLLHLLNSDLRRLPVVFLAPYANGTAPLIDANQLAKNLAGMAVVVRVPDPEVTWDFADEVGRQLSCFNGAARIYWPGFSADAEPRDHRLFLARWIEQVGPTIAARSIERAVFAVAAFRFVPDNRITEVIKAVEGQERQRLLLEKKASGDEFWDDYERDLALLDEANTHIQDLEAEVANLKANQNVLLANPLALIDADVPDDAVVTFSSVAEAVEAAKQRFDNVEILETAAEAARHSPFQKPSEIYEALSDLSEIAGIWQEKRKSTGSGGDLLQHLRARGWGKRSSMHISDTTRSRYRSHYEFSYNGGKQLFEPHITIGSGDANSCASIHFILDQERGRVIVGHVGRHLPNTKT